MASYSIILRTQWQCILKYNLINGFMKDIWIETNYSKLIKPSTLYQNFILLVHIDTTPFGLIIFFN